jgi:hypothetical protein
MVLLLFRDLQREGGLDDYSEQEVGRIACAGWTAAFAMPDSCECMREGFGGSWFLQDSFGLFVVAFRGRATTKNKNDDTVTI